MHERFGRSTGESSVCAAAAPVMSDEPLDSIQARRRTTPGFFVGWRKEDRSSGIGAGS
jgi:hypothetical protein